MKKLATPESPCQPCVTLQLPLPLLSGLKAVRDGFFELCVRVGEHALHAMMEQGPHRGVRSEVGPRCRPACGAGRLDRE